VKNAITTMDLSVIIVCYRAHERVIRCLEALDSFSGKDFGMEVIVVNNNPGDIAFREIENRFTKYRIIHNTVNGGYSNGCNLGVTSAQGKYLLFLNPDTVATENAVQKLLLIAKSDPSVFIVSCRQVRKNGKESKAYGDFPWEKRKNSKGEKEAGNEITFPDWVSGSVMMIPGDIFNSLKGFDEDFWMYYEDVDLCRRAREKGGEIAFCNDITMQHDHGGSTRADLKITSLAKCEVQISKHLYIKKHKTGISKIFIQALTVADNLLTGILTGLAGLLFFFIPKLFVRFLVILRMTGYYTGSLFRRSWISPRSVNFRK
jgi:GT2 family glycosyltransferase